MGKKIEKVKNVTGKTVDTAEKIGTIVSTIAAVGTLVLKTLNQFNSKK